VIPTTDIFIWATISFSRRTLFHGVCDTVQHGSSATYKQREICRTSWTEWLCIMQRSYNTEWAHFWTMSVGVMMMEMFQCEPFHSARWHISCLGSCLQHPLCTNLLSYSLQLSPSGEATSILWNPKVQYHAHNNQPLDQAIIHINDANGSSKRWGGGLRTQINENFYWYK
jgi:hypothetical protein